MNYLILTRFFGGTILSLLFGHQCLNVYIASGGYDFVSVAFLITVLVFYGAVYLVKFHLNTKNKLGIDETMHKRMQLIQIGLLILSWVLAFYEVRHIELPYTFEFWMHLIAITVFIVSLDVVLELLVKLHEFFTDNDKEN